MLELGEVEHGGTHRGRADAVVDDLWGLGGTFLVVVMNDLLEDLSLQVGQSFLLHSAEGIKIGLGPCDKVARAIVDVSHHGEAALVQSIEATEEQDSIGVEGLLLQFTRVGVANRFCPGAIGMQSCFPADNAGGLCQAVCGHSQRQTNGKKSTAGFHVLDEDGIMLSFGASITILNLSTCRRCSPLRLP